MRKTILYSFLIMAVLLSACAAKTPAPTAEPTAVPATATTAPTEKPAEPTATTAPTEAPAEPTATAEPAVTPDALAGTDWQWVYFVNPIKKVNVDDPENYTLSFKVGGLFEAKADCNNLSGTYEVTDNQLKMNLGPMTLAACPVGSLSDDYVKYLGAAAQYFMRDSDLFIGLAADAGTMQFSPAGTTLEAIAAEALKAEPITGSITAGGGPEKWLDPTLISALGGTNESRTVDVSTLSPDCVGYVPTRPDLMVNWTAQEGVDALRLFFLSMGDPSLLVVTPSGKLLCNDNLTPLVRDPFITVENPETGKYAVYLGTNNPQVNYPGFLVVTTKDLNPATLNLAQMFPRKVDPRGIPESLSENMLKVDGPEAVTPTNGKITPADLPFTQELTGGGKIGAYNFDKMALSSCTGYITAEPTFRFDWEGDIDQVAMYFEGDVDSSLIVRRPDGTYWCGDNYSGRSNVNPYVILQPTTGTYNVWVGTYAPDVKVKGVLTITNDLNAEPAELKARD